MSDRLDEIKQRIDSPLFWAYMHAGDDNQALARSDMAWLLKRVTTLEAALEPFVAYNGGPKVYDGVCQFCFEEVYSNPELHTPDCFVRAERARR